MSTRESTEKKHSSLGEKIKGAAHIVHGIGEDFRGSVMGALESASGSAEAKTKDEEIAAKGKSEIEQGIAQMKGLRVPANTTAVQESHVEGTAGEQPQEQPVKEAAPGATPAPPPSPVQSKQAESETAQQGLSGQSRASNQAGTEGLETGAQQAPATSQSQTSQTGDKGSIGGTASADVPQGPGDFST